MAPKALSSASLADTSVCALSVDDGSNAVITDGAQPVGRLQHEAWMTVPGVLTERAKESIGNGQFKVVFKVFTIDKPVSYFFRASYPKIPTTDPRVTQYFEDQAQRFALVDEAVAVYTSDGEPLLYYIPNGMKLGLSDDEYEKLRLQSGAAATEVIRLDKNKPNADTRVAAVEIKRQELAQRGLKLIRKHYTYGKCYCGRDAKINTDAKRSPGGNNNKAQFEAVVRYMKDTAWEHAQIGKLLKTIDDSGFYEEAHERYQKLQPEMEHLYQGPEAFHLGLDLLVNVTSGPHRDDNDIPEAWTTTNTWGTYQGGNLVLPELGLRIAQIPGDVVMMHARVLVHMVLDIYGGNRICNVHYSNKRILKPAKPDLHLPCPICQREFKNKAGLLKHLRGPSGEGLGKAKQAAANRAAKWEASQAENPGVTLERAVEPYHFIHPKLAIQQTNEVLKAREDAHIADETEK